MKRILSLLALCALVITQPLAAYYSLTVETTSNATAGGSASNTVAQFLMPASREARLVAILIKPQQLTNTQQSGQWVVDRITAVTAGSTLVPLKLEDTSAASAITDTTKTISTTLACTNTVQDAAICQLSDGWNLFSRGAGEPGIGYFRSGVNKGFAIRRATAPTGAQVVDITVVWEEL